MSLQCQDTGSIPGQAQWVKGSGICCSCGVGHNCGSDLIPGPGTPYAMEKEKKKEEEKKMARKGKKKDKELNIFIYKRS